jgi:hypothetical protein
MERPVLVNIYFRPSALHESTGYVICNPLLLLLLLSYNYAILSLRTPVSMTVGTL